MAAETPWHNAGGPKYMEPQPRGGKKELARSRELLVAARGQLDEEIERLSHYHRKSTYVEMRLVEKLGTVKAPGMLAPWWGAKRLYEETYSEPVDMDRPEWVMETQRRTPGYFFSYQARKWRTRGGPRTYVEMTVSPEGRVELTSGSPLARPATVEGLKALLNDWD
jgi:hypothetical protein